MLFNSFHYLLFLLLVIFIIEAVRRKNVQHLVLLLASYYFYWTSSASLVLLLLYSSYLDFFCGRAIHGAQSQRQKRLYLGFSLIGNLGVLAYFKYTNFALGSVRTLFDAIGWKSRIGPLEIYLPIGISFYTFQSMSYSLDIYFGKLIPVSSLRQFALYVSFFPQLVAGPIVRARQFLPQLLNPVVIRGENLKFGLTLILYGLIKKVCIADNLSGYVQSTFGEELTTDSLVVIVAAVAFAIQIYCDFSGYTDIAIGSARILGFKLPRNFAHPYFAGSISEFWKRWHISLSTWLRDYLYVPLGGNQKGRGRQLLNLMITMLLGGLWHGAAWHFVLWGFYQGFLLCVHKFVVADRHLLAHAWWRPLKILFTFYLTCIGWLIFITPDLGDLLFYLRKMCFLDFATSGVASLIESQPLVLFLMGAFLVVHTISYLVNDLSRIFSELGLALWAAGVLAGIVLLYLLAAGQQSFIYFQF